MDTLSIVLIVIFILIILGVIGVVIYYYLKINDKSEDCSALMQQNGLCCTNLSDDDYKDLLTESEHFPVTPVQLDKDGLQKIKNYLVSAFYTLKKTGKIVVKDFDVEIKKVKNVTLVTIRKKNENKCWKLLFLESLKNFEELVKTPSVSVLVNFPIIGIQTFNTYDYMSKDYNTIKSSLPINDNFIQNIYIIAEKDAAPMALQFHDDYSYNEVYTFLVGETYSSTTGVELDNKANIFSLTSIYSPYTNVFDKDYISFTNNYTNYTTNIADVESKYKCLADLTSFKFYHDINFTSFTRLDHDE